MKPSVAFVDWGVVDYGVALERQRELFERLIEAKSNYEVRSTNYEVITDRAPAVPRSGAQEKAREIITNYEQSEVSNDYFRQSGDYATLGEKNDEGVYSGVNDRAIFETAEAESPLSRKPAGWLVLCEHPPVYTLGRSGRAENLLVGEDVLREKGAALHRTERGGDITFHGPGQIVGYPILDLERLGLGLREYIEALEQAVIDTVAEFGIQAGRVAGKTGVWVGGEPGSGEANPFCVSGVADARLATTGGEERTETYVTSQPASVTPQARPYHAKLCAIGVKASRGVVMHGFALNVATDLGWFEMINPCGFVGGAVTSVERETGAKVGMEEVKRVLIKKLEKQLFNHDS